MLKLLTVAALVGSVFSQQDRSLNATLASTNETSALASLLGGYPELLQSLASASNVTLLAPSNDAISELLDSDMGEMLQENPDLAQAVLMYHVLNGTYRASDVTLTSTFIPTLLMNDSYTNVTGGQVVGAVRAGDNVVFVSGLSMNSTVSQADVNFTGGVIHIIDSVLTIPESVSATATAARLSSLAGALVEAKLADALDELQNVTIFVPSNDAFQSIGSALEDIDEDTLAAILQYHVVEGTVAYSSMLEDGANLTTLGGENVTISIEDGNVFVNSAQVTMPDVLVSNGVVHVIDNVLNPSNTTAMPEPSATSGSPGFSGASSASDAPYTSNAPEPTGETIGSGSDATSTTSSGIAPQMTGAVGAAALFGAGAYIVNM